MNASNGSDHRTAIIFSSSACSSKCTDYAYVVITSLFHSHPPYKPSLALVENHAFRAKRTLTDLGTVYVFGVLREQVNFPVNGKSEVNFNSNAR